MPCQLRYWFKDVEGKYTSAHAFYVASSNLSAALQFGEALGDILSAMTGCNLTTFDFLIRAREYPYPAPTGAEPPINKHGVYILETATPGNRHIVQVPGVADSILVAAPDRLGGIEIDQANADVVAFRDSLVNGDGTVAPIDLLGDDLTDLTAAYQQWRVVLDPDRAIG